MSHSIRMVFIKKCVRVERDYFCLEQIDLKSTLE